jgi:small subunit ribosomal protein S1
LENQRYKGVVSYFETQKHYGFIESEGNSYYFNIDIIQTKKLNFDLKNEGKPKLKFKFRVGDEVSFILKLIDNNLKACEIEYLGNPSLQLIIAEAAEKHILSGYLQKIKERFFVKHISTNIFLPIKFSKYEIDLDLVYEKRINQLIQFQLKDTNRIENIKAELLDRRLCYDWEKIQSIYEMQEDVFGYVKRRTKGGFIVEIEDGIEAFLPGGQINIKPIFDFDFFVGKSMNFKIISINREYANIVLSHIMIELEKFEEKRNYIKSKLQRGQIIEAVVKNIVEYGIFVDLGGIDGLIHISKLKEENRTNLKEDTKIGDIITVKVLDFKDDKTRIQLGFVSK